MCKRVALYFEVKKIPSIPFLTHSRICGSRKGRRCNTLFPFEKNEYLILNCISKQAIKFFFEILELSDYNIWTYGTSTEVRVPTYGGGLLCGQRVH